MLREKLMVQSCSPRGGRQFRGVSRSSTTTARSSRGFMFNLLWMAAYLCITVFALIVFSVVPEILSVRHPNPEGRVPLVELSKVPHSHILAEILRTGGLDLISVCCIAGGSW